MGIAKRLHALKRGQRLQLALRQDARQRDAAACTLQLGRHAQLRRNVLDAFQVGEHQLRTCVFFGQRRTVRSRRRSSLRGARLAAGAARWRPAPTSCCDTACSENTVTLRIATSAVMPSVIASRQVIIAVGRCHSSFQISLLGVMVTWPFVIVLAVRIVAAFAGGMQLGGDVGGGRGGGKLADQHARRRDHDDSRVPLAWAESISMSFKKRASAGSLTTRLSVAVRFWNAGSAMNSLAPVGSDCDSSDLR